MRKALVVCAVASTVLAVTPAAAQLYRPGVQDMERAGHEPAGHSQIGTWQALAISPTAGKDAWTSQSMKDDRFAALNDVVFRCNMIMERLQLQPDCMGYASQQWVASYYCRRGSSVFGEGATPVEAVEDALAKAAQAKGAYCEFKALRGPEHGMAKMTQPWRAMCQCGERSIPLERTGHLKVDSAVLAINDALIDCAGRGRFAVVELSIAEAREGSTAQPASIGRTAALPRRTNGSALASALIGRAEASEQPAVRGRSQRRMQMAVAQPARSNSSGGPRVAHGTFCVEKGIFSIPRVRIGSCRPEGGGCISLDTLTLGSPNGKYMCGSAKTDMNRRFSFPRHKGDTKRFYGRKQGTIVYFDRSAYR